MADTMALSLSSVVLGPYNWTRDLIYSIYSIYSGTEKVNLVEQELKTQLLIAKEHIFSQEQKVSELSTSLDLEMNENKTLWDQVAYLTNELHRERGWRQQQTKACQAERAKASQEYTQKIQLAKQLEETKKQLAHQKSQEELVVIKERELMVELETLTASYNELCQAYSNVYYAYSDIQQMYDTDLRVEKEKNDTLQQQLEEQVTYNSNKASRYNKKILRLKLEQEGWCQKMEHESKVAAVREESLHMELEDLKIKLHRETSTNLELVAKIKAEEEERQALQKYIVQIMEELNDKASEQREKSPAVLQDSDIVEEESIALSQDSDIVEEESIALSQDSDIVEEESIALSQDSDIVEEESIALSQDSDIVEEESIALSQDSGIVEEESIALSEDSDIVEEESIALSEDSEIVEEESIALSQDSEIVEEESIALSQDSEIVEEESIAVSQDSELVGEESIAVLQDSELVEEESIAVLQDSELQEEADVSEEKTVEKNKKPSFWKRIRHFLGLRKKNKKRPKKESTSICDFNT